jgi:hypothetical protein
LRRSSLEPAVGRADPLRFRHVRFTARCRRRPARF